MLDIPFVIPLQDFKCFQFFLLKAKTIGTADVSKKKVVKHENLCQEAPAKKSMYDMALVTYFEHLERFLCP